ncbi:imelysin family protein [Aequorivita todarodis]|uniref:imelysin family protein n=1 Tax=Aequorivita todarodis TaxID=2036821 RepID=UPI00235094A9|nr:imelysin family protein [Aequorivita todarodis]MDC8002237.1 imelysin family protein [Aequorivita todarodis]
MKKSIFILALAIAAPFGFTSCSDNDPPQETQENNDELYKEVLTNLSLRVITETYNQLYTNSLALEQAANAMAVGDEAALETAKSKWQDTRAPWEESEGFLYGPVDTEGIDPAIDSWPVDVNAINNVLNSGNPITQSLLESNNEARGFHTLEYFFWGLDGDKTATDLTAREIEYIKAAASDLRSKTEQLYFGWLPSQGNFASNFINAGESGSVYTSKINALSEIAEGIEIIADEVANGKIEEPLNGNNGGPRPEAEESRFSNNSKLDFANNIRSIEHIYHGDFNGVQGKGLTDIVSAKNPNLDTEIKTAISEAIVAIEAIPGTFTQAIFDNRAEVEFAQGKVLALLNKLQSQLVPLISNLN